MHAPGASQNQLLQTAAGSNRIAPDTRCDRRKSLSKTKNMHSKRFRKVDHELCKEAVRKCFDHKWKRLDTLQFIEEYAGVDRKLIIKDVLADGYEHKEEAIDSLAYMLQGIVEDLAYYGIEPDDIEPVTVRIRPDGLTGKEREIALLCIMHQLLGHVTKLIIDPLMAARLHPTQHASIPKRGQTQLKDQVHRYFLKESLGVKYVQKTDVVHAYATLMYSAIEKILVKEIPKAKEAHALIKYLGSIAPGGHLIIGGYLDAWLFNFAMSYAITDLYKLEQTRRGKTTRRVIRAESYMDDLAIMTSSEKNMKIAFKRLGNYCNTDLGVDIRATTGIMRLLPIEEEKRRKKLPKPSQRGVPMLDMAGYRISRTHVTIRRRVFRRIRRNYLRAWEEYQNTGTVPLQRANRIISYYGYFKQSDSEKAQEKYHVQDLLNVSKKVVKHHQIQREKKRKEQIYDLQRHRIEHPAPKSPDRESSGRD